MSNALESVETATTVRVRNGKMSVTDGPFAETKARADMLRRLGRTAEAAEAYRTALGLTRQEPERRFIERRLRDLVPET